MKPPVKIGLWGTLKLEVNATMRPHLPDKLMCHVGRSPQGLVTLRFREDEDGAEWKGFDEEHQCHYAVLRQEHVVYDTPEDTEIEFTYACPADVQLGRGCLTAVMPETLHPPFNRHPSRRELELETLRVTRELREARQAEVEVLLEPDVSTSAETGQRRENLMRICSTHLVDEINYRIQEGALVYMVGGRLKIKELVD